MEKTRLNAQVGVGMNFQHAAVCAVFIDIAIGEVGLGSIPYPFKSDTVSFKLATAVMFHRSCFVERLSGGVDSPLVTRFG